MALVFSKTFFNQKLFILILLGFASGLPLALIGSTLQAWFTEAHINLMSIGALSLVGMPYLLKFLWAPLIDHYHLFYYGKYKGWILVAQFLLVILLFYFSFLNPQRQTLLMVSIALLIAFFSASQDIAIDAYRTNLLTEPERGLGAACHVFAYRIATLIAGGFALLMADYLGWQTLYQLMALLLALTMIGTFWAPKLINMKMEKKFVLTTVTGAIKDLYHRRQILWIFLFIVFYKFGDALALSLMTNFLLKGLGFSLVAVGLAYKIVSFLATILGVFIGGLFLTRLNIYCALMIFGLAQAFSNLTFVGLVIIPKSFFLMSMAIFIENFCSGLSTSALLAFFMYLCHLDYSACQYALLSTIASCGRVLLGPLAALLVNKLGWRDFYLVAFCLSFPGIFILYYLRPLLMEKPHAWR